MNGDGVCDRLVSDNLYKYENYKERKRLVFALRGHDWMHFVILYFYFEFKFCYLKNLAFLKIITEAYMFPKKG